MFLFSFIFGVTGFQNCSGGFALHLPLHPSPTWEAIHTGNRSLWLLNVLRLLLDIFSLYFHSVRSGFPQLSPKWHETPKKIVLSRQKGFSWSQKSKGIFRPRILRCQMLLFNHSVTDSQISKANHNVANLNPLKTHNFSCGFSTSLHVLRTKKAWSSIGTDCGSGLTRPLVCCRPCELSPPPPTPLTCHPPTQLMCHSPPTYHTPMSPLTDVLPTRLWIFTPSGAPWQRSTVKSRV